jgi:hypothetical protein
MSISDLISDWASFEAFISTVCATKDVSVQHNVILRGKSGAPRQIDVAIRSSQGGLISHLVLVECKYWRKRVKREQVDGLVTAIDDLNASRGIIFSTEGFQEGAVTLAEHKGVELFKLRELAVSEQFGPSTPLHRYRHYLFKALRELHFPGIHCWTRDLSHLNLDITLGGPNQSKNRVLNTRDYPSGTLETIIEEWSSTAASNLAYKARGTLLGGTGGFRQYWTKIRQTAQKYSMIQVPVEEAVAMIPVIEYELGITLWQEPYEIDNKLYEFIVAIEDCIRGVVLKASRTVGATETLISPVGVEYSKAEEAKGPQRIILFEGYYPFDFDGMEKRRFYDKPGLPDFLPVEIAMKAQGGIRKRPSGE